MDFVLLLILVLSAVCQAGVWHMLRITRPPELPAPRVVVDAPDYTFDWKGLV